MVTCIGLLATLRCEPRQTRKGATAAADACAGIRRVQVATHILLSLEMSKL